MSQPVVIIGAGLAGMTAALAAALGGARVICLDRGAVGMGTNSAISNGFLTGPTSSYGRDEYVRDTMAIGAQVNWRDKVEQVADGAFQAVAFARDLGTPMVESADHYEVIASRPEVIPGVSLVRPFAAAVSAEERVQVRGGCQVLEVLRRHGRAVGVRYLDKTGEIKDLAAGAVVLAAGGAGAIYARHDNMRSTFGQAYALAARAGVALRDLEFVQFYPLVLDEPGLPGLLIYPPYPSEARLLGAGGEDILESMGDINSAVLKKRDTFSAHIYACERKGPVRLDLTQAPETAWQEFPLAILGRLRWDWRTKPARVGPGAHFFMGGVRTDGGGRTSLPGLLACGEVTWGLHGANRRGGNALMECLVTGLACGQAAAGEADQAGVMPALPAMKSPEPGHGTGQGPAPEIKSLWQRLKQIAWTRAGIVRNASGLQAGLTELVPLRTAAGALPAGNAKELRQREDFGCALLVLEAILSASRLRTESRGALTRSDFPQIDEVQWRASTRLILGPDGSFRAEKARLA